MRVFPFLLEARGVSSGYSSCWGTGFPSRIGGENRAMGDLLEVTHARPEEFAPAFRLIFRHVAEADREARVANALWLIERGEIAPDGMWVARRQGALQGAV